MNKKLKLFLMLALLIGGVSAAGFGRLGNDLQKPPATGPTPQAPAPQPAKPPAPKPPVKK
jgi:hypothetical protein